MRVYKWMICIVLVIAIAGGVIYFGGFRSDESTLRPEDVAQTEPETQSVTEFTFSEEEYCTQLLQILNGYRQRNGLSDWAVDDRLSTAAVTRAYECSIQGEKTHKRTDGAEWYTVLDITENYNYSEILGIGSQSPADMARSWVGGSSINAGLLDEAYTVCGIGCSAVGSDVYVALILYKP